MGQRIDAIQDTVRKQKADGEAATVLNTEAMEGIRTAIDRVNNSACEAIAKTNETIATTNKGIDVKFDWIVATMKTMAATAAQTSGPPPNMAHLPSPARARGAANAGGEPDNDSDENMEDDPDNPGCKRRRAA